jgi:hypothetical protein
VAEASRHLRNQHLGLRRHQFRQDASQARIHVPWDELRGKQWRLTDSLSDDSCDRSGDEMRDAGLYVDLVPWGYHAFSLTALP